MNINPFRKSASPEETPPVTSSKSQAPTPSSVPTSAPAATFSTTYPKPRRPIPETTDGKLFEIIKRLGRMERDIIEIRNKVAPRSGTRLEPEVNYDQF